MRTLIAIAVLGAIAFAHPAGAERRCLTSSLKAGAKVASGQARQNASCIKRAGKGKEASPAVCLTEDASGVIAKLSAKTVKVEATQCEPAPDFGWAGAAAINTAAVAEQRALVSELFGDDLDAALTTDATGARCQAMVAKLTDKVAADAIAAFRSCAKRGLADGSIASADALAACLRSDATTGTLAGVVEKKCAGIDLADAFPGACADAASLAVCLGERVVCRTCRMLGSMAGLDAACDALDDGVENASCSATSTPASTTTTTLPASGDCPSFLDVAQAPGAGSAYAAPALTVSCTDDEVVVRSNGIPHYTFVAITPNPLAARDVTYRFPRAPALAAEPSDIPLLGSVGVAVNGMPFFGPNEAAFPDPYGDPFVNAILDGCLGHTSQTDYHYHALAEQCLTASGLVAEPWLLDEPSGDTASPVLAYALDGFPVHGPFDCTDASCSDVIRMESSWENVGAASTGCASDAQCDDTERCALAVVDGVKQKACVPRTYAWDNNAYVEKTGAQWLDRCNGHVGPHGDYHYHATDTFPYVIGCYAGER